MVTAADRGAFLWDAFWRAQAKSVSLFSLIKAGIQAAVQGGSSGRQIIATSGNGRSVSFDAPNFLKELTPDDVRQMWYGFWQIYQDACTTLGISLPVPTDASHDQSILNAMVADDRMQKVDSFHIDHTLGRWPSGAGFTQ